uniref:Putative secreted protein n=1 Tax=Anopheles darlingi TaxID=43151 RepID=A0A2M4DGA1_ANODA
MATNSLLLLLLLLLLIWLPRVKIYLLLRVGASAFWDFRCTTFAVETKNKNNNTAPKAKRVQLRLRKCWCGDGPT